MSNNQTESETSTAERGCGCCMGCLMGPLLLFFVGLCLAYVIDWFEPEADFGDGAGFLFLLTLMFAGTGAFLGYIFPKPIVEFLKEIKWRIWDT